MSTLFSSSSEDLKRQVDETKKRLREEQKAADRLKTELDELNRRQREVEAEERTTKRRLDFKGEIEMLTAWAEADKAEVESEVDEYIRKEMVRCRGVIQRVQEKNDREDAHNMYLRSRGDGDAGFFSCGSRDHSNRDVANAREELKTLELALGGDVASRKTITKKLHNARLAERLDRLESAMSMW